LKKKVRKKRYLLILLFIVNIINFLRTSGSDIRADDRLKVFVSIVPQKYFVEKIGGDLVDVSVMVQPGANPAVYEPKPQQMAGLTKAEIYFAVGVPFETVWLKKIAGVNTEMMIVHTEDGIEKMPMKAGHHHGEETDHTGVKDPHIWLAPPFVMIQARNILHALMMADPERASVYKANYREFILELVDLDLRIIKIFSTSGEGLRFMVYHPAWGYFAESYGLEQIPIEIEGKEPKARELQDLLQQARVAGIKAIFVQPQLSSKSAHTIAKAIGCRIVTADPLAEDWAKNLLDVADKFRSVRR